MIRVILITIVLISEVFALDLTKDYYCLTPYNEDAICQPVSNCEVIKSALATLNPQAFQFAKDSQCGCDMGMVCCGSSNNRTYPPLKNCTPSSKEQTVTLSRFSDESICGIDALAYRIKGGKVARFEEFPWLAALEYKSKFDHQNAGIRCGGSIITKRFILTAAHCIVNVEFVIIKAWVGVTNISSEGNCLNLTGNHQCIKSVQRIDIAEGIPHPSYMSLEGFNDIGLVRLENPIKFSDYIRPICLPAINLLSPRIGTYMTVAGWGATENSTRSDIKLKVDVPIQNATICQEFLKRRDKQITTDQLCVGGEKGKDSCQGDSGGPLMKDFTNEYGDVQWYQEGIVSYGSGCGIRGRPSIYVRVSSYVDWMFDKINKLQFDLAKGDPCTTPSGTAGTCEPLNTCEVVHKAVTTKYKDGNYFARKSYCGYDEGPMVCCQFPGSIILPNYNSKALPNKTTCGVVKENPRIFGGEITDLGEFPWVAGIEYTSKLDHTNAGIRCAGSVITTRYVLTVAHCLKLLGYDAVSVWLGDWNTSTDPDCNQLLANVECADPIQKLGIKQKIPHVLYSPKNGQNDIGLILVDNEIKFSDYVSPICLPSPKIPSPTIGTLMTAVGWGYTENYTNSEILRKVKIPLVPNQQCDDLLRMEGKFVSSQQLCAGGENGKDTCQGDTGGPLMRIYEDKASGRLQWYQDGLPSYGIGCGIENFAAVYIRIASYMDWIINIISED